METTNRSNVTLSVSGSLRQDLKSVSALLRFSKVSPLPLQDPVPFPPQGAVEVWTDASGHIVASPSIGIFVPSSGLERPLVAALALPRSFLQAEDEKGHKSFCKTTTLECLAYLTVVCLDPMRFVETSALFHIDNGASVLALQKGRSKTDPWATTLVRAARVVAAFLGCSLFTEWERRRSSRNSEIADDLTHNLVSKLNDEELVSYLRLSAFSFPSPILQWMAKPAQDSSLGYRCVEWLRQKYPELNMLKK